MLYPESFYEPRNQMIYSAIRDLSMNEKPVDVLTVTEQLSHNGKLEEAGGPAYIAEISSRVASSAHIEYHARIVAQKFLARQLIQFASDVETKAFDETIDVDDLMQHAEGSLFELSQKNMKKDYVQVDSVIETAYNAIMKAYENKETAWPARKMRYRGIVWSCPAHYYANFSNWLANCWGIDILVEMESLNFTKHLETEDKEEALRDLARLYERMVMRRHTNGGYQNVVDECWRQVEAWNAPLVIMYQNVACKNMATVQGILDEQGRQRGYDLIWVEHDLMDPRTVSSRTMRDKVNEYMRTVMRAEPVDPSLVEFEDEVCM
jgi:hypothetical protein